MAGLKFTLEADVKKLQELRKEIEKVTVAISKLPSDSPQIRKLETQLSQLRKEYDGIETLLSKVQLMGEELAKSENLIKHTRKQTDETKKATEHFEAEAGSLAALEKQAKSLTKEWLAMSEARKQSDVGQGKVNELAKVNAQIKIEKDNLRALQKEYVNTQKIQDLQEGSIKSLRAELSNLNAVYDSLGRSQRKGAYGKELLNGIQTVYKELVEAEQASGRFQRVVGNYASAFNGLGFSVQQVARELPSLAISANTFFLAISNNLPMLADEIKKASLQYKAFKAELAAGNKDVKAVAPVWQQLAKSIISWQTALVVGITLLSVYGKEVINWGKELVKGKNYVLDLLSAEQELALARRKGIDASAKERVELDLLYTKLKSTSVSQKERTAAANAWISRYPKYADVINGEKVNLDKLKLAYNALSKEIEQSAIARSYMDKVADIAVKKDKEDIKLKNQQVTLEKARQRLLRANEERDKALEAQQKGLYGSTNAVAKANDEIVAANKAFQEQNKIYNDISNNISKLDEQQTAFINHINTISIFPQPKEGTYDYWKQQVEIADDALKQITSEQKKVLDEASKNSKKDLYGLGIDGAVVDSYKKAVKDKAEAEKQLKVYGDSSKEQKMAEKEAEKRKKEQEKLNEDLLSLRRQNQQAEIDLMEEGTEKKLKQIDLDYQKELDAIKKQEKDLSERQGGKLTSEQSIEISARYINAENKREKDIADYYKNVLSKYQDYITKRLEIEKRFDADREKLQKSGASDAQLNELEYQRTETLNSIDKEFAMREDSFQTWVDDITKIGLEKLRELLVEAERELERSEFLNPNDKGLAVQRAKVVSLKNTINKKSKETDTSPDKRSRKEWQELYKMLSKVEDEFDKIGSTVGGTAGEILSAAGSITSSTLQMIDGITLLANSSATAMEGTAKAASSSIKTVEKASVILAIISAALQIATKIASLFDDSEAQQRRFEEYQRRQEGYWQSINYQTERYLELLKEAAGNDYFATATKSLTTLEKAREKAYKDIVKSMPVGDVDPTTFGLAQLFNYGKFSTKMNEYAFGGPQAKEIFDFIQANGGYDLENKLISEEAIWAMKSNADIWSKLPEWMQQAIDKFVEFNDKAKELEETLNEDLFQTTSKGIEEAILEGLKGGKRGIADFGEDFEEIMRNALLQSFVIDQLRGKAQEFYKKYTLLADSDENGKLDLTAEEISDLRKDWNDIIRAATEEAKNIDAIVGGSSSSSQEASKKGFATASQDSIDELNGRFTALQIAGEEIKNQSVEQTRLLDSINSILLNIDPSQASFNIPDLSNREALNSIFAADIAMRAESNAQLQAAIVNLTGEVQAIKSNVGEMLAFSVENRLDQQTIAESSSALNKNLPKITQALDGIKQNTNGLSRR